MYPHDVSHCEFSFLYACVWPRVPHLTCTSIPNSHQHCCRESKGAAAGETPIAEAVPGKPGGQGDDEEKEEEDEEEEVDEFDQMDAEEREEAFSCTSHRVSWREARTYLFAVLTAR